MGGRRGCGDSRNGACSKPRLAWEYDEFADQFVDLTIDGHVIAGASWDSRRYASYHLGRMVADDHPRAAPEFLWLGNIRAVARENLNPGAVGKGMRHLNG